MTDTLAPRKILAVLVPWFNTVVQPELELLRPVGVSNQTARFSLDARVLEDVAEAAEKLVSCGPDALIVGLSTESFPGGLAMLKQGVEDLAKRTGLPVFSASHACHAALRSLGATRIGVVTPFDAGANGHVRAAFESEGFEVIAVEGLACAGFDAIARSSSEDIRRLFREVDSREVEALVQVGTGLPSLSLVEPTERALGKPLVACNAAVYWQALRGTGIEDSIQGFGRLLAEH